MAHARGVADNLAKRDWAEIAARKEIEIHHGSATFAAYDTVEVDGVLLPSHRFIIASGSRAKIPAIPGLVESGYLDADSIWTRIDTNEANWRNPKGCTSMRIMTRKAGKRVILKPGS